MIRLGEHYVDPKSVVAIMNGRDRAHHAYVEVRLLGGHAIRFSGMDLPDVERKISELTESPANGVEHGQTAIPLSTVKRLVRESKLIDKWSGDALIAQLEYAVVAQRQS